MFSCTRCGADDVENVNDFRQNGQVTVIMAVTPVDFTGDVLRTEPGKNTLTGPYIHFR
jgi:hypothetical protein